MTRGSSIFATLLRSRAVILVGTVCVFAAGCRKQQAAGGPPVAPPTTVIAAEAKRQVVAETLAVVGTLLANESIEIRSETDGIIAEILFQEGQPVKKGDLLIRLDASKFAASLAEAEANLKLSTATLDRNKQLLNDRLISQQEYDQAASLYQANLATVELRRRQLQDTRIHAPFSGVTGARRVSPGQVIERNTTLTWLVDLETLKAEFHIPERFLREVRLGQRVQLAVAAFPNRQFPGEVYFIGPQIDPITRTLLLRARVPNDERQLKPGMFASLDLTLTLRDDGIVIPEAALMSVGERTSVYVITETNTAAPRPVKVGVRMPNQIEIVTGLQVGEKVIVEGLQKVRPGGPVKVGSMTSVTNAPPRT